jgi:hypothetical protein
MQLEKLLDEAMKESCPPKIPPSAAPPAGETLTRATKPKPFYTSI